MFSTQWNPLFGNCPSRLYEQYVGPPEAKYHKIRTDTTMVVQQQEAMAEVPHAGELPQVKRRKKL